MHGGQVEMDGGERWQIFRFSEVGGGGNPDICEWLVSELNRIRK